MPGSTRARPEATLAAGTYSLYLAANGMTGTYTLNLDTTQNFTATVPLAVTAGKVNGAAVAGAGTFETTASQDKYTFTVPAGGTSVTVKLSGCPTANFSTPATWQLVNSAGTQVDHGYCGGSDVESLAAGAY